LLNKWKSTIIKITPYWIFKRILILREKLELVSYLLGNKNKYHVYLKNKAKKGRYKYGASSSDPVIRWGEAFCDYNSGNKKNKINLMWTEDPCPGNYGDWLSPYIISKISNVDIRHISGINNHDEVHLIALGSVIDCANEKSVVIGAGISDKRARLNKDAKYLSVRGRYTAELLKKQCGIDTKSFGDIGFAISRIYKPRLRNEKNKKLLVRHARQSFFSLNLPSDYKEYSIFAAKAEDIELFVDEICNSELVITSAMHCFITCISYGIPCKLVSFGASEIEVPGDGVKFIDALSGMDLPEINPVKITISENMFKDIESVPVYHHKVSKEKIDAIEESIQFAVDATLNSR
jgi:hypothetical protein